MLDLTENARTLIKGLTDNTRDRQGGVRITPDESHQRRFDVTVASEPAENDVVIETAGARVLLEPRAAQALEHKTLDATLENGAVSFNVLEQPS